jgi:hypothetical protein
MTWIAPDAARAGAAGAGPATILAFGAGAPGDSLGERVALPPDACGLFLARGGATIEDLDLFVYADDGSLLGSDETASARASALVCPPHGPHVYAFGRVAAGRGLFAVSAQVVPPADAERAARAVGARGPLGQAVVAEGAWPGLEEALAVHRKELGGAWKDAGRVAVPMDPRTETRLGAKLEAGQCVDFLVLPAEDVAYIELTLLDAAGRIIGRAPSDAATPSLVACTSAAVDVGVGMRPRAGRGVAAVVTSVTDDVSSLAAEASVVPLGPSPLALDAARAALGDRLAKAGYGPVALVGKAATVVGRRTSVVMDVPEGCSRIDVVAGAPSRGLEAWLWSSGGALLAHGEGDAQATLFACGGSPGARLDVEAVTHAGPFSVDLRPMRGAAKALGQAPLAAGRMLSRISDSGGLPVALQEVAPRDVPLGPSALFTDEAAVPAGSCLEVVLALGAGAEGAELRLVDAGGSRELALARGTHSARAEACVAADASPGRVRIEARAAAGAARGLLATRLRGLSARP